MNTSQKAAVKRQGILRRIILYLLKDTGGIRFIIFGVIAVALAIIAANIGTDRKDMTTTHPLYLPKNVQPVENFNMGNMPQIEFPLDRYWAIVKSDDDNFMSIRSEEHGQRIAVDYYFKDRNSGVIIHAVGLINSPNDNGVYCYVPTGWRMQNGQLVVERHYQVYDRAEEVKVYFLLLAFFMVLAFVINSILSLFFMNIIKKMDLPLIGQTQA